MASRVLSLPGNFMIQVQLLNASLCQVPGSTWDVIKECSFLISGMSKHHPHLLK